MAKIHISRAGIPTKCPAKIQCRLAPDIGHFDKVEQAQEFADQINELKAQNRTHLGINSTDVTKLSDAELVYISNKIKDEAEANENYKDYKGSVKWQKEVRSKASREMQAILKENNTMTSQIGEQVDKVDSLTKLWKKEKDPGQKRAYYNALKIERGSLNALRDSYGPAIQNNLSKFKELRNKKEIAEQKILDGMKKQALHSETKAILADVESEINERGVIKNSQESYRQEKFSSKISEVLNNPTVISPKIGDVTTDSEVRLLEDVYSSRESKIDKEIKENSEYLKALTLEKKSHQEETRRLYSEISLPENQKDQIKENFNYSEEEYKEYLRIKNTLPKSLTQGINNQKLEYIIKTHALVEKFGQNKGRAKDREITEKDLSWISDYNGNPELLKSHLSIINNNRKDIKTELALRGKYSEYEAELEKKEMDYKQSELRGRNLAEQNLNSEEQHLLKRNQELLDEKLKVKKAREDVSGKLEEYSRLTSANNGKPVNVSNTEVLTAESSTIKLNKDNISVSSNGNIDNVFVRINSTLRNNTNPIYKVSKIENGHLVLDNGETLKPSKTLRRRTRGSLDYKYDDLEIIYGEKMGTDYNGNTEVSYNEYDSTD